MFRHYAAARKIAKSIRESPEKWKFDIKSRCTMKHVDSGENVWVGNGRDSLGIWTGDEIVKCFGWFSKRHLWIEVNRFIKQKDKAVTDKVEATASRQLSNLTARLN